jgi:sugar/nucleoside kinase (ribokinase family)
MPPEPCRILCAGIVVLDELFRVKDFPPPDGKVEASAYVTIGGGNAANAAITIARLGGMASYAGPVGDDAAGDRILANLARENIDTSGCVRVPGTASPVSVVFVNAHGERSIVTHRGAQLSATRPADGAALVSAVDGVLIDNRMATFARPIAEAARARNLPVVFDADKATTPDDPLFAIATHVIFSSECLRQTVGEHDLAAGVARMARLTRKFVAATNGPGDLVWSEGDKVSFTPVFKIVAVDTLAAGDIFHGAFALALVEGCPIAECLRFAAATAGLKCTRFGGSATIPTRAEVEAFLKAS